MFLLKRKLFCPHMITNNIDVVLSKNMTHAIQTQQLAQFDCRQQFVVCGLIFKLIQHVLIIRPVWSVYYGLCIWQRSSQFQLVT